MKEEAIGNAVKDLLYFYDTENGRLWYCMFLTPIIFAESQNLKQFLEKKLSYLLKVYFLNSLVEIGTKFKRPRFPMKAKNPLAFKSLSLNY